VSCPLNNLRYRIDIITPSTSDGFSDDDGSVFAANLWADVADLSGLELIRARKVTDKASHRVKIHYQPGVEAKMQVRYEGRIFNIEAVLDEGQPFRNVWLTLLCSELQSS
jgi:SPP1 family predicted phage head-tail adaptor